MSIQESAIGCTTSPIGFIEGWFVVEKYRRQGVGKALVETAEVVAQKFGCEEMACDTTFYYPLSPRANASLGYKETERPLNFIKKINGNC